jgi:lipoprotein NlpI
MAPNDGTLYSERCAIRGQLGVDLDAALADCEKSLVLKPSGKSFGLESRGIVKFRRGDFAGAVADMNAVLAMSAQHSDALYIRGLAKRKSGDITGGDADIAAAKAIDPKIADTYASYGVTP